MGGQVGDMRRPRRAKVRRRRPRRQADREIQPARPHPAARWLSHTGRDAAKGRRRGGRDGR